MSDEHSAGITINQNDLPNDLRKGPSVGLDLNYDGYVELEYGPNMEVINLTSLSKDALFNGDCLKNGLHVVSYEKSEIKADENNRLLPQKITKIVIIA